VPLSDKDTALPLSHLLSGSIGPLFTMGWAQGIEAQRDADWEIMKRWVEALKELLSVAAHRSGCGSLVTINDRSYLDLERCDCPHGKAVELLAQRDMEVEDDSS